MQNKQILAALIATVMFATVFVAAGFVSDTEASQSQDTTLDDLNVSTTSTAIGAMNVYINSIATGSGWSEYNVIAYDGCEALLDANDQISGGSLANNIVTPWKYDTPGYWTVNPDYGSFTQFLGLTNDSYEAWFVYVYVWDDVSNDWSWESATEPLGFYRPFADYSKIDYRTANIALVYKDRVIESTSQDPDSIVSTFQDVTAITATQDFAVNFTLIDTVNSSIIAFNVTGYGSDVFCALKELASRVTAVGPVVGNEYSGEYYSWMTSIAGLANATSSPWTPYWAFYTTGAPGAYTDYTMGWHSPLDLGYIGCDNALLIYGAY